MVVIRLSPSGKKGDPVYKILVTDKAACLTGRFIEKIGLYKPGKEKDVFNIKAERLSHWIKAGAQVSPRIHTLLKTHKVETPTDSQSAAPAVASAKSAATTPAKKTTEKKAEVKTAKTTATAAPAKKATK